MKHYNYQKSYKQFKNIRNRIGRLNGEDLLRRAVSLLHHADAANIERQRLYGIWDLLLLVKWTIMFGDFSNYRRHEHVTEYQFNAVFNRIKGLSEVVRGFRDENELFFYFRHLAFQQFWTQRREALPLGIARQYAAFGNLDEKHRLNQMFLADTGISISNFLEMSIPLLTHALINRQPHIAIDWFQPVMESYGSEMLTNYLNAVSRSVDDMRDWLQHLEQQRLRSGMGVDDEYFEPTPFLLHPLLKVNDDYIVISPDLLVESLSTYVHGKLKDINNEVLMSKFGGMFEALVEQSLRSVADQIYTEEDLVKLLGRTDGQRLVDFLIVEGRCNIFVESKGIAMSAKGMVAYRAGTVRRQLKSTVLKGMDQAFSLANLLQSRQQIGGRPTGPDGNYLLIVTYKDLHVGQGQEFRDSIAPDEVGKIVGKYGGQEWIPLSNVFILSIDELDTWLGLVAGGAISITESLETAARHVEATRAWNPFRQLYVDYPNSGIILPYLEEASDELFNRVINRCEFQSEDS